MKIVCPPTFLTRAANKQRKNNRLRNGVGLKIDPLRQTKKGGPQNRPPYINNQEHNCGAFRLRFNAPELTAPKFGEISPLQTAESGAKNYGGADWWTA